MKKPYYLIIISVTLVTIATLSLLSYSSLLVFYVNHFDPHTINAFFITRNGKSIQNVSISLFAFYPTSHGTVIRKIYQGSNLKSLSIPLSNLTSYADHWLKTYNYIALKPMFNGSFVKQPVEYHASAITPSLIGFASYHVINKNNGTITIYSQPFTVSVSPYNITQGIGKTIMVAFVNPIVKVTKIPLASNSSSTPQQEIITTTTVPKSITEPMGGGTCCVYDLDTYWIYPYNNSQLGPIPLAVAYVTDPNTNDYSGGLTMSESASSSSGYAISFGISLLSGIANIEIIGTSITLHSGSVSTPLTKAYFGCENGTQYPNFAEIYTCGQIAIANFTAYYEYYEGCGQWYFNKIGTVTMFFITGLQVIENNGAYVPVLYVTNTPTASAPISSFFTGKLEYITVAPPRTETTVPEDSIYVSTSEGFAGGGISLAAILTIAKLLGATLPWWVPLLPSPYISIVPFSSSSSNYKLALGIWPTSSNTYYIYNEVPNISYNIGGNNYNIPMFYFYINYTTS